MTTMETNKVLSPNASPDKKGDKSPLIDLKNGKVVCKQKSISFEKQSETLQEIVKFREMLEGLLESGEPPLSEIPQEHQPLIAKLAHESDKGLTPLAKHIRHELLPVQDEEDAEKTAKANGMLPLPVVEAAISSILNRHNYGIDAPLGVKLPATLAVWRWEVKESFRNWLPKSGREKAELRLEERKLAKKTLNAQFESLPQSERDTILRVKGPKPSAKEVNELCTPEPSTKAESLAAESATKQGKKRAEEADNEGNNVTPKSSKQPKPVDPEKAAKEKERLEKKAAKAERERKVKDDHNKSRSIMANFFSKPKVIVASARPKEVSATVAGPSKVQSDFERTFKPFVPKKGSIMAPTNWFKESHKPQRKQHSVSADADIIVIDDEDSPKNDVRMSEPQPSDAELAKMTNKERLRNILLSMPPSANPSRPPRRRKLPFGYRTYYPISVRDIMNQLSEAEVAGDDGIVRSLLSQLQNRVTFPPKVFIFTEDARPGYYGTWTRSSHIIGPRRPLAKDLLVFDYGYDSGEEWEEEPVGEDVAEDNEEEEDAEDVDSDADSWLVDDDEEPEVVNLTDMDSLAPPDIWDLPPLPPKRKADDAEKKQSKKRKVVVPLVPFAKGPCWEDRIGEYTPFPIDPFTYVSTCIEDHRASQKTLAASAANTAPATYDGFAIPSVPIRLSATSTPTTHPSMPSSTTSSTTTTPVAQLPPTATTTTTRKAAVLKTPFPDAHLPYLVKKIAELETSSFVLLVETVYEALKPNKVTKAAVEAKIREVGEKDKAKKKWTVKPAFMAVIS